MHTNNLCNANLGKLGQVLSAPPSTAFDRKKIQLVQSEKLNRYCFEESVILDYADGMTSLILYQDDTPQIYYLDRMILLRPGVLFSLAPMGKESHVCFLLSSGAAIQIKDQVSSEFLNQSPPSLEFERLYTFFYQKSPNDFYFRGESHEPYELVYVDQGILHNLVDGQDLVLHQQECVIIGRGSWHIQYSEQAVRFLTVSFDLRSPFIESFTNQVLFVQHSMKPILENMAHELERASVSDDYVESLLKIFLIELIRQPQTRQMPAKLPSTDHAENDLFDQLLQQISKNITDKIDLHTLADSVHISVPYLYLLFGHHLGMPPRKYINKIRMEESKLLLQDGTLTIGEVAKRMGFSSVQHFSRLFKSVCGLTPSQYLKGLR